MKWTTGKALGASFGLAFGNFTAFFIVALVISLPSVIVDVLAPTSAAATIVSSLVVAAMTVCGTYGALRMMAGEKVSAGDMLKRVSQPTFWPLVGLAIVQSVGIAIGMMLLVVPGLILLGMWMIAAPVMMVEGKSVIDSLNRSADLTKGSRLTAIATFVAAVLLSLVPLIGGLIVMYVVIDLTRFTILAAVIEWLLGGIYMALLAPLQATIYALQRQEKEGVSVEAMAPL